MEKTKRITEGGLGEGPRGRRGCAKLRERTERPICMSAGDEKRDDKGEREST